jgi:hypothetical protein
MNLNFSMSKIVNNKKMRISKLQKWMLTNAREVPFDDAKSLTEGIEEFSPKAYFYLNRRAIMKGYFSDSYIASFYWQGRKMDGFDSIVKPKKASAEVVLSRSLKTLEEHGLIIRVRLLHMSLKEAEIMRGVMHGKSNEEIRKAIENIDSESECGWLERVTDFRMVTQGIFLTDKGIEFRNRLLDENKQLEEVKR